MRKTWKEYKREQRRHQKEREREAPDHSREVLRRPFFDFFNDYTGSNLAVFADAMGEDWWAFKDNGGIKPLTEGGLIQEDIDKAPDSLGRAELILACLIDAAGDLAGTINEYKRKEICDRIQEIEASALDTRKRHDLLRLKKMLDQLDKQVRWTFPQWKVTGE